MFARCFVRGLLLLCLGSTLVGCANSGLDSVQVTPGAQALTVGQTAQFTATGTYGNGNHPSTQIITSLVTWTSSTPSVATVSASGVATAVGGGTTTITATSTAFNGPTSSSATLTVTGAGGGGPAGGDHILSLIIIPSAITVGNLQDTGQFLAIGTFSTAPTVRDLTNSSTLSWISTVPSVFPVNTNTAGTLGATAGIVTAYGNGGAVIVAKATSVDGAIQTATANFNCPLVIPSPGTPPTATSPGTPPTAGSCFPGSQAPALLATLTIYNEGLNTTNWKVTAPSAFALSTDPPVLHCGPGSTSGSVCVATYPFGTSVILTATGGAFGGWSYNCIPTDANGVPLVPPAGPTQAGPNYCKITFANLNTGSNANNTNVTVGAIFN
jgi:hypothetical protein